MRLKKVNDRFILCGIILHKHEIHAGQEWMNSGGHIVTVFSVDLDNDLVFYSQDGAIYHHKDIFSFQCRYSLILEVE